jgi:hypothetical protein
MTTNKQLIEKIKDVWKQQEALERKLKKRDLKVFETFKKSDLLDILQEEERDLALRMLDLNEQEEKD